MKAVAVTLTVAGATMAVVLAVAYRRQVPDPPGIIVPYHAPRSVP